MRIALVLAATLTLALASVGCCSSGACSACDGSPASNCSWGCPKLPGSCCGWDFYVPCDMIEGRESRECAQKPTCVPGQVVSRSWAVPATPCAPPAPVGPTLAAPPPLPAPVVRPEAP